MNIFPLSTTDLPEIEGMQPEGWGPITPVHRFYLDAPFCYPIKAVAGNKIVGIGTAISLGRTGWLGHVIVHPEHQNKGLGSKIVENLLARLASNGCQTVSLIATDFGKHLYCKFNFKTTIEYHRFERAATPSPTPDPTGSEPNDCLNDYILKFDMLVSGECRTVLLKEHLAGARCIRSGDTLDGVHLPDLGEGFIMARNARAGLMLLAEKCRSAEKVVIPSANKPAIEFLTKAGYTHTLSMCRMTRGKPLEWRPEFVYCRIGGNLG